MKPEVSEPTRECPEPQLWQCYDEQTAEFEVLEFLQALVRTMKPRLVVETGSFRGIAANYIGLALKQAGRGRLVTCEINHTMHEVILKQCASVLDVVECRNCSSLELKVKGKIDLLFTDSEPEIRCAEIAYFWNQLRPESVIVVHDVNSGPHLGQRRRVLALDRKRVLSVVLLPTPRGLAICQKVAGRDGQGQG